MPKINQEEYYKLKKVKEVMDGRWNWLARNKDGTLKVYNVKPNKNHKCGTWGLPPMKTFKGDEELFQFTQWEDEEPHNIAELIEEYEDSKEYKDSLAIKYFMDKARESEEPEVKKDIEWLKEKVLELQNNGNVEVNQTEEEREIGRLQKWAWNNCVDRVYELINQLDEPEVLSQEWIDNHKLLSTEVDEDGRLHQDYYIRADDLQSILVPKHKKVEVPQFVADWFEESKEHFEGRLKSAIKYPELYDEPSDFDAWLHNPNNKPIQTLGNMFNGYEVEGEQKYIVKGKDGKAMLYKVEDDSTFKERAGEIVTRLAVGETGSQLLTEQEIKDYDERYIPFMVPVEEDIK